MQEWQERHQHVRDCQCAVKACGQAQTMYTERAKGAKINAAKCATNKATAKKKLKVARASLKDFVKIRSLRRKGLRTQGKEICGDSDVPDPPDLNSDDLDDLFGTDTDSKTKANEGQTAKTMEGKTTKTKEGKKATASAKTAKIAVNTKAKQKKAETKEGEEQETKLR